MIREGTPTELPSDALTIAPDQVAFIVVKARAFSAKVGGTRLNEASSPADEAANPDVQRSDTAEGAQHLVLENMRNDPSLAEYRDAIDGLATDEQLDLVALAWIGRGEYEPEDWEQARREAADADLAPRVSDYLLRDPLTGEEIAEGMSRMGFDLADYGAAEHL